MPPGKARGSERGRDGQFVEGRAEDAAEIAVGVAREYGGLHDDADHDTEEDLLDAGQGVSPRIVRMRHSIGRHHDESHPGEKKSVGRAGLSEKRHAYGHDDKSGGEIEER